MSPDGARIGYVPYSPGLTSPADRRRLPFWSRLRGHPIELYREGERYDVVVLAGTADIAEWSRHPDDGTKIVYELIDSYLELPRYSPKSMLRGLVKFAARETSRPILDYRRGIEKMCRRADAVVCSTPEQRATLLGLCLNVHEILDAHIDLATRVKETFELGDTVNLVWEGLPNTLDDFLGIRPALRDLAAERSVALHVVTDLSYAKYANRFARRQTAPLARRIMPNTYLYEWNSTLLADIVTSCDVAIIPLDLSDSFARAKPENKLLLFWRMGMPVVTSASPAYRRVMGEAGVALTCTTSADWGATLRRVLDDESLRRQAAAAGLAYVNAHHDEAAILARWDRLFASVLG